MVGGGVKSLDKSVFWTQQGSKYNYGKDFRDKNLLNSDQWIFKVIDFLETDENGM